MRQRTRVALFYGLKHTDAKGGYEILVSDEIPGLLCTKIQSRDIAAKQYICWVNLVMEWWMCDSANIKLALELLGCAARIKVKSVIWYISFGRKTVLSTLLVYGNLKFIKIQIKPLPTTHLTFDS